MNAPGDEKGVVYVHNGETTIPVPVNAEWTLRYGTTEARETQRLQVASVVATYSHLLDKHLSTGQADLLLHRLRAARRNVATGIDAALFHGVTAPSWATDGGLVKVLRSEASDKAWGDEVRVWSTPRDQALLRHAADRIEQLSTGNAGPGEPNE